jgi:hypothetical protein
MKLTTLTTLSLLSMTSLALAGGGAPVPEGSQKEPPSGRPSQVLDDATCDSVWKIAAPSGDTLAKDKAAPFVINYDMVDTSKDGMISADEFKTGCSKGWVQKADASTVKDMKDTSAQ